MIAPPKNYHPAPGNNAGIGSSANSPVELTASSFPPDGLPQIAGAEKAPDQTLTRSPQTRVIFRAPPPTKSLPPADTHCARMGIEAPNKESARTPLFLGRAGAYRSRGRADPVPARIFTFRPRSRGRSAGGGPHRLAGVRSPGRHAELTSNLISGRYRDPRY